MIKNINWALILGWTGALFFFTFLLVWGVLDLVNSDRIKKGAER